MAESETIKVPHLEAYLEHLEFQRRLSKNTVRNSRKAVLIFVVGRPASPGGPQRNANPQ